MKQLPHRPTYCHVAGAADRSRLHSPILPGDLTEHRSPSQVCLSGQSGNHETEVKFMSNDSNEAE